MSFARKLPPTTWMSNNVHSPSKKVTAIKSDPAITKLTAGPARATASSWLGCSGMRSTDIHFDRAGWAIDTVSAETCDLPRETCAGLELRKGCEMCSSFCLPVQHTARTPR